MTLGRELLRHYSPEFHDKCHQNVEPAGNFSIEAANLDDYNASIYFLQLQYNK